MFELPEVSPNPIEIQKIRLEASHTPDLSLLNPEQIEVFDALVKFAAEPGGGFIVLKGLAGTGKTFTLTKWIEHAICTYPGSKMVLTAPTNKAVKVLYRMANWYHTNVEYATVHSTLCLVEKINADGSISFVPRKDSVPTVGEYKFYIVDEVSMLQDELFDRLEPFVEDGVKFIFMGDPIQIPPVKRTTCIPFKDGAAEKYGWKELSLSTIVRQALDNPIVGLTLQVRKRLGNPISIVDRLSNRLWDNDKGVFFLDDSSREGRKEYLKLLKHMFCSENFKADADFAKVIAWRNKTVDATNKIIRRLIYGPDAGRIEVGEKLITNEPILLDGKVIVPNSEELEVISFEVKEELLEDDGDDVKLPYYEAKVLYRRFDNSEKTINIQLVTDEGMPLFTQILELLVNNATSQPRGSYAATRAWMEYYEFKRKFADVNYNYCLTAHKAQGSTYDNVIVIERDIDANNKVVERNRIKYTAFSRPRHRLFII